MSEMARFGKAFWLVLILMIIGVVGVIVSYEYHPVSATCTDAFQGNVVDCWNIPISSGLIGSWVKIKNNDDRNTNINYSITRWSCTCNATVNFRIFPVLYDYSNTTVPGNFTLGRQLQEGTCGITQITNQQSCIDSNGVWTPYPNPYWVASPDGEVVIYADGVWYSGDTTIGINIQIIGNRV